MNYKTIDILVVFLVANIFFSIPLSAQEKLLTFNASGAATSIDKIIATNLVTGKTITVVGVNTIILEDIYTGLNQIEERREDIFMYPNPSRNKTTLQLSSSIKEEITILLISSTGQIIAENNHELDPGIHKFKISCNTVGVNHVVVVTSTRKLSRKLVCLNVDSSSNAIDYIGSTQEKGIEKSQKIESGELIHFEISSGNYTTIIADQPIDSKSYDFEFVKCQDKSGKNYKVVQIGNQWFMAENLAYLPGVNSADDNSFTEARNYVYGYDGTNVSEAKTNAAFEKYGVLYNWEGAKIASPDGWHLPSDDEWEQLADFINTDNDSVYTFESAYEHEGWWNGMGKHLKTVAGWSENGVDDYGFSAKTSGFRTHSGKFVREDSHAYWWSATDYYNQAWNRELESASVKFYRIRYDKTEGFSVRCIRD